MSRGQRIRSFLKGFTTQRILGLEVNCMPPTGDCFYSAVVEALYNAKGFYASHETRVVPDVSFLRHIVADSLERTTFESYRIYYESGIEGYEFMKDISSLQQLKDQLSKTGKELARKDCIWADHYAVQCIADFFNVSFLIFNEQNNISTTKITPSQNTEEGAFIILYLTRRNHYNLIGWKRSNSIVQFYFLLPQTPEVIQRAFGLQEVMPEELVSVRAECSPHKGLDTLNCWDWLPDELLQYIFEYFDENVKKFVLSNVCDRWGRIVWGHFVFPLLFPQSKKRIGKKVPKTKLVHPVETLADYTRRVPHIKELIYSIEMEYFDRGWMESLVQILPHLREFHFFYGPVRKFHIPNPDLKVLLKAKSHTLQVLRIQPRGDNALPIVFTKCAYNALNRCTKIHALSISIHADANNILLSSLPISVRKLVLFDSWYINETDLVFLLEKLATGRPKRIQIELFDTSLDPSVLSGIQQKFISCIDFNVMSYKQRMTGKRSR